MTFEELATKWEVTLSDTTAPLPVGTTITNLVPGYVGEATKEGRMQLMVDYELLTGREVIELLLYGELVHIDRQKEKKLIRIHESQMAAGFEVAVIAVAASLGKLIDILRLYADGFIKQLPADVVERIEAATDPR